MSDRPTDALIDFIEQRVLIAGRQTHHLSAPLSDDTLPPAVLYDVPETGMAVVLVVTPVQDRMMVELRSFIDGQPAQCGDQWFGRGVVEYTMFRPT